MDSCRAGIPQVDRVPKATFNILIGSAFGAVGLKFYLALTVMYECGHCATQPHLHTCLDTGISEIRDVNQLIICVVVYLITVLTP